MSTQQLNAAESLCSSSRRLASLAKTLSKSPRHTAINSECHLVGPILNRETDPLIAKFSRRLIKILFTPLQHSGYFEYDPLIVPSRNLPFDAGGSVSQPGLTHLLELGCQNSLLEQMNSFRSPLARNDGYMVCS